MGHFGRAPITRAWLVLVFPACILSYLGQGALILDDPRQHRAARSSCSSPTGASWPLVVLATAATVIASQAVITGAFSVAHQAVAARLPPAAADHPHLGETIGQIYVPSINWLLLVSVLTLVLTFKSSAALAFAFGMAVTGDDHDHHAAVLLRRRAPVAHAALARRRSAAASLLTVDLLFLAANLTKLVHGAWLPLLIGAHRVHRPDDVAARARARHAPARARGGPAARVHRRAARPRAAGAARARHRRVPQPQQRHRPAGHARQRRAPPRAQRARRDPVDRDRAGAARPAGGTAGRRRPRLRRRRHHPRRRLASATWTRPTSRRCCALLEPARLECPLEVDDASLLPVDDRPPPGRRARHGRWRKRLFLATSHITADAADYFHLPRERTVIVGSRIDVRPASSPPAFPAAPRRPGPRPRAAGARAARPPPRATGPTARRRAGRRASVSPNSFRKSVGRAVEHGAELRAAGLLDQPALEQRGRRRIRADAADARDLRAATPAAGRRRSPASRPGRASAAACAAWPAAAARRARRPGRWPASSRRRARAARSRASPRRMLAQLGQRLDELALRASQASASSGTATGSAERNSSASSCAVDVAHAAALRRRRASPRRARTSISPNGSSCAHVASPCL